MIRRRHTIAVLALAAAAAGCVGHPTSATAAYGELEGIYFIESLDGDSLPRPISTTWVQGTVVTSRLQIDQALDFRMQLGVRPSAGGALQTIQMRGYVWGDGAGRIRFVGYDDQELFQATYAGERGRLLITIPQMRELSATWRWGAPVLMGG